MTIVDIRTIDWELDEHHHDLSDPKSIQVTYNRLCDWLAQCRAELPPAAWHEFCHRFREHPLADMLCRDPFIVRALTKPRGYAGDAVLLDMAYRLHEPSTQHLDPITALLNQATLNRPAIKAARWRRRTLSEQLDHYATRYANPTMVSVAAGHLREIADSQSVHDGLYADIWALDQDRESLDVIDHDYRHLGVHTQQTSVAEIIAAGHTPGAPTDIITSSGLYDYLDRYTAATLTTALINSLRPGGTLLIANVAPFQDAALLEAAMDWFLIERTATQMLQLLDHVPKARISKPTLFSDSNHIVTFLEVSAKSGIPWPVPSE
ncbi:methyltransferase [Nocardia sp. JMUB6875]|uniref:hypothetical protein n=1 Tax=Nocardia sp. JMUB6875 TaxID=3158170 RepID=UPI0032E62EB7